MDQNQEINKEQIEIIRYTPDLKKVWDDFVESSKNGTFLFKRNYMEYHSDRFNDISLLIYKKGKLYSLFPANISDDTVYSHQGLTYGGLVMSVNCSAEGILEVFDHLKIYLKDVGVKEIVYKSVPYIYSSKPSEEDLYALFRNNATLKIRNISSVINRKEHLKFSRLRRRCIEKSKEAGINVERSEDYEEAWEIIINNLKERYDTVPVHSLEEIKRLAKVFPHNIALYLAKINGRPLGAGVFYISKTVVHAQYIHANPEGKEKGAVDAIVSHVLEHEFPECEYFDFGTSNGDEGRYLHCSLIQMKEGFGGRGVCYDTYHLKV